MKKEVLNHPVHRTPRTIGQKFADVMTSFVGSWVFILLFIIFLIIWMAANTVWLVFGAKWDPHPFIFLNLVLAVITALQAPIILMSQNRQAQRDRLISEYDYKVNKKAEAEISEIKNQLTRIEKKIK